MARLLEDKTMTPGTLPITLYAFASFSLPLQWTDNTGAPIDLTGYKVRMQIRERVSSSTPVLSIDNGLLGGIAITDAVNGKIQIDVTDEQTGAITIKSGFYDVVVENPSGDAVRLIQGVVTIVPGVTRPTA